jgi:hypothetical protein
LDRNCQVLLTRYCSSPDCTKTIDKDGATQWSGIQHVSFPTTAISTNPQVIDWVAFALPYPKPLISSYMVATGGGAGIGATANELTKAPSAWNLYAYYDYNEDLPSDHDNTRPEQDEKTKINAFLNDWTSYANLTLIDYQRNINWVSNKEVKSFEISHSDLISDPSKAADLADALSPDYFKPSNVMGGLVPATNTTNLGPNIMVPFTRVGEKNGETVSQSVSKSRWAYYRLEFLAMNGAATTKGGQVQNHLATVNLGNSDNKNEQTSKIYDPTITSTGILPGIGIQLRDVGLYPKDVTFTIEKLAWSQCNLEKPKRYLNEGNELIRN